MRAAVFASVASLWLAVICLASPAAAQVRAGHPRIYLTDAATDALRPVLTTDRALTDMRGWMGRRIAAPAAADTMLGTSSSYVLMSGAAFLAHLSEERAVVDEARRYLAVLAATGPTSDLLLTRNRLLALAIGYDWLYSLLDATERADAVNQIVAHVNSLARYLDDPNYVSGPSRWANVTSLAGCIAISHDDPRLDATLAGILDNWRNGYNPVLDVVGEGGGHQMAWYYGPAYSGVEAYWMWRTATDGAESWNETYLHDAPFFSIYAANGQYHLPVLEDSSSGQADWTGLLAERVGYQGAHAGFELGPAELLTDGEVYPVVSGTIWAGVPDTLFGWADILSGPLSRARRHEAHLAGAEQCLAKPLELATLDAALGLAAPAASRG